MTCEDARQPATRGLGRDLETGSLPPVAKGPPLGFAKRWGLDRSEPHDHAGVHAQVD